MIDGDIIFVLSFARLSFQCNVLLSGCIERSLLVRVYVYFSLRFTSLKFPWLIYVCAESAVCVYVCVCISSPDSLFWPPVTAFCIMYALRASEREGMAFWFYVS